MVQAGITITPGNWHGHLRPTCGVCGWQGVSTSVRARAEREGNDHACPPGVREEWESRVRRLQSPPLIEGAALVQASAAAIPLADESVQCVVTSPPYWGGVRAYESDASAEDCAIGNERTPEEYVTHLIEVFREVRRVLSPDGSLWLNLGDVYAASGKGGGGRSGSRPAWAGIIDRKGFRSSPVGYKPKDLTLVAFAVADGLRKDGWFLRQTIIWKKPHATEPMRLDRPAVSHEYLFLLAKSEHYAARDPGEAWWGHSVWEISRKAVPLDHPAVMPDELARRCIAAGSRPGDIVFDPFNGSGTTGRMAVRLGRHYVGADISRDYLEHVSRARLEGVQRELIAG